MRALTKCVFVLAAMSTLLAIGDGAAAARAGGVRWTFAKFRPVSQPSAVASRFVLYAAGSGGLRVVALDVRSGRPVWTALASPSAIAPGVPPTLLAVDGEVIILRPVFGQRARLVAIDARTGRKRWASNPGYFTDWPERCLGEPSYVCDVGTYAAISDESVSVMRFRVRDGHRSRGALLSTGSSLGAPRAVGPGLFDTGQREPEVLESASPTRRLWLRPLADIFGVPDASTDNGWDIDRVTRAGLFVGSVLAAPSVSSTSGYQFDFAAQETVGFSIVKGSVAWTDKGSLYACGQPLPCPGEFSPGGPSITLRFRATGILSAPAGGGALRVSPGASVAVEGFDATTGKNRWSFNAGHDVGLLTEAQVPPQLSSTVLALPNASGAPMLVDLSTGAGTPVASGAVAWCRSLVSYHEDVGYPGPVGPITQYVGGYSFFPCDPTGHRRLVPTHVPSFVGSRFKGIAAFSDARRVLAVGQ